MTIAAMRVVVVDRPVLRTAIIPQRDRVSLPMEAALELGRLDVPKQVLEDGGAFLVR